MAPIGTTRSVLFGSQTGPDLPILIDSFEDGDIAEYSGDTGSFSVVQDRTFDGDYALYSNVTNGSEIKASESSGLPATPKRGDVFKFSAYVTTHDRDMHFFWAEDNGDFYAVRWWSSDRSGLGDEWTLHGSSGALDGSTTRIPQDQWITVEVDFSDPIVAEVYEEGTYPDGTPVVTLSASDNSLDSGGIAWYANAGSTGEQWFDGLEIINR